MLVGRLREVVAARGHVERDGGQRLHDNDEQHRHHGDDEQLRHDGDDDRQPDDRRNEQRQLVAALIAAKVMYEGERELLYVRPRDRVTAISLPEWINSYDL